MSAFGSGRAQLFTLMGGAKHEQSESEERERADESSAQRSSLRVHDAWMSAKLNTRLVRVSELGTSSLKEPVEMRRVTGADEPLQRELAEGSLQSRALSELTLTQ